MSAAHGEDFLKALDKELSSDFERVVLLSTLGSAERDAYLANEATKRFTSSNWVLMEIATTRSSEDLFLVRHAYHEKYKKSLEEDVAQHTTSDFRKDHLALMMELLAKIPRKIANGGARSKDYFDRYGDLKRINRRKHWPLDRLLLDKYKFSETDAREFSEFQSPFFDFAPEKRPNAQQCLQHPWLTVRTNLLATSGSEDDPNIQKVNIGMSNLRIKANKR